MGICDILRRRRAAEARSEGERDEAARLRQPGTRRDGAARQSAGAANLRALGYDAAGNIVSDTRTGALGIAFTYDVEGRLATATPAGGGLATYTYDALGRLASRTVNGTTILYVHDQQNHIIAETDATGATQREYVWMDDLPVAVVDQVASGSPQIYFVHTDHLARPAKMTDANQNLVWDVIYAPFGAVSYINQAPENIDIRFPGQWFQLETGLAYNWHRHYDATLGRYVQPDPLGLPALMSDGPSVYGYVGQNPLGYADPDGLQTIRLPLPIPLGPWTYTKDLSRALADAFGLNSRRTWQTYTRYNPKNKQCYSGRTSGYADAWTNVINRGAQEWMLTAEGFLPPELDRSSTSYDAIRGREQQLIEINGGAASDGGVSRNVWNGIYPWPRWLKQYYLDEAIAAFGLPVPGPYCTCP